MRSIVVLLSFVLWLRADDIDRIATEELHKQHIPGMSIGVMRDGRLIKAKGYGLANIELNAPATSDTVYGIGSVSKQFIAAGILLLAQDGKLTVDDRVSRHLHDAPPSWSAITIRHLLTHTSGLVRESPVFEFVRSKPDIEIIRGAYRAPLAHPTGSKYMYCNLGYFTLAEIITRVSGTRWPEFLDERIFDPLMMDATRTTTHTGVVANRASSYDWKDGTYTNAHALLTLRPSGALLSNVIDIAKWDAALYTNMPLHGETKRQAWTPVRLNDGSTYEYGFGWNVNLVRGHRMVSHGGTLQGFKSQFSRFPDDRLSIVVFTNVSDARPNFVVDRIADLFLKPVAK
ncbi:MAG: beta-lactamase family protein [Acidobacteria bacterium]|nr:beta-lactamase family protein [Acidobacteriota bacterium]